MHAAIQGLPQGRMGAAADGLAAGENGAIEVKDNEANIRARGGQWAILREERWSTR
jgi:hypothetical protein